MGSLASQAPPTIAAVEREKLLGSPTCLWGGSRAWWEKTGQEAQGCSTCPGLWRPHLGPTPGPGQACTHLLNSSRGLSRAQLTREVHSSRGLP